MLNRTALARTLNFLKTRFVQFSSSAAPSAIAPRASRTRGGLRLDSRDQLLKGGRSGPAAISGDPERSLLIRAIRRIDDDLKMPPEADDKLSPAQIQDFVAWEKKRGKEKVSGPVLTPFLSSKLNSASGEIGASFLQQSSVDFLSDVVVKFFAAEAIQNRSMFG
jgi:hypothetical protein